MAQTIGYVSLLVRDYDEAIAFFTQSLDFSVVEDSVSQDRFNRDKRWVLVRPRDSHGTDLLLAKPSTPEEQACIGNQTGGRVFLFLHTDDFWRDYRSMTERGVKFVREAARGRLWHGRGLRRLVWQQVGLAATQTLKSDA